MKKLALPMLASLLLSACATSNINEEKLAKNDPVEEKASEEVKKEKSKRSKRGCGGTTGSRLRSC